jgi:hypothetical protein
MSLPKRIFVVAIVATFFVFLGFCGANVRAGTLSTPTQESNCFLNIPTSNGCSNWFSCWWNNWYYFCWCHGHPIPNAPCGYEKCSVEKDWTVNSPTGWTLTSGSITEYLTDNAGSYTYLQLGGEATLTYEGSGNWAGGNVATNNPAYAWTNLPVLSNGDYYIINYAYTLTYSNGVTITVTAQQEYTATSGPSAYLGQSAGAYEVSNTIPAPST